MIAEYSKRFNKNFRKRIASNPKLASQFINRLQLLANDPSHPTLKLHKLTGKLNHLHSFSLTGDIRVLFEKISDKEIFLYDIGSHNQVY
ncbi:hypothetical protein D4S03_09755 [bacterium]|nr:MAG: hypothetical protein D4S03_09755 [bacterium]